MLQHFSRAKFRLRARENFHWYRQLFFLKKNFSIYDLNVTYHSIVKSIDIDRINILQKSFEEEHKRDTESAAKYPDIQYWLKLNILRAIKLELHRVPPKKILDIGCGSGYFMKVARHFGHTIVGVDAPNENLTLTETVVFSQMLTALGEQKQEFLIEPMKPFRRDLGTFDLITSFMVCYNGHKTRSEWGRDEWDFFLSDISQILNDHGELYLELNGHAARYGELQYYTESIASVFEHRGNLQKNEFIMKAQNSR